MIEFRWHSRDETIGPVAPCVFVDRNGEAPDQFMTAVHGAQNASAAFLSLVVSPWWTHWHPLAVLPPVEPAPEPAAPALIAA